MTKPVLNIIGTGKLGTTLGLLLAKSGSVQIGSLYSRNLKKSEHAAKTMEAGKATDQLANLCNADYWMVSVADDAISAIAEQLSHLDREWHSNVVFHCSGSHNSSLLSAIATKGAHTASFHPAHSFANTERSLQTFAGTCCTLEGTTEATTQLIELFAPLGITTATITAEMKSLYHAATAVASNHLVALLDTAIEMLINAGLDKSHACQILSPLVSNSCSNFFSSDDSVDALTGPISRGDSSTIEHHLAAIRQHAPQALPAYVAMAQRTLFMARGVATHQGHEKIAELLLNYASVATNNHY